MHHHVGVRNNTRMELHHIRAFLAVAEELHFGRAALKLHVAQPPLSRTIRQLEREMGTQLFERTTRSVKLTAAGEALIDPAREILDGLRLAKVAVSAAGQGITGRVRLGFAGTSSHKLVARLARAVRQDHPGIDLVFHSLTYAGEGLSQVIDGSLDLGIVRWDQAPPDLDSRPILEEHHVLAVPVDHPLAGRGMVSMAELRDEQWVALPSDPASHVNDSFVRRCHEAGYVPDVVQRAPDSWTVMALVGAGVGISFTYDSVTTNVSHEAVATVPLKEGQEPVWPRLAWRSANQNPALRKVLGVSEMALPTPQGAFGEQEQRIARHRPDVGGGC